MIPLLGISFLLINQEYSLARPTSFGLPITTFIPMSNLKNIITSGWYLIRLVCLVISRIFGTKTEATFSA
ncbi:MAG: hypothetical protein WBP54_11790, partial [Pelodictyon phaeoclathratiforme]